MWRGTIIGFAQSVTIEPVAPVADPVAIQPLNAPRPVEILTPAATRYGVLRLTLTELYGRSVWQQLSGLADSQDLVDIMQYVARQEDGIRIVKRIRPHISDGEWVETFHNCVIARINDNETIDITTMEINKEIEVWYTHATKNWINGGNYQFPRGTVNT
jgi:hypothetical protein